MNRKQIQKMAKNSDFVPGIYNYCDRWCERCPFTERCMNFALSEEQFSEPVSRDIRNKLFWQKLSETFRLTRELLEETLHEYGIDLNTLDRETAEQEQQRKHDHAENHECSQAAKTYSQLVDEWFESAEELFDETRDQLETHDRLRINNDDMFEDIASLNDSIEILHWYQHQIYVKLMRALSGRIDERSLEFDDDMPKDSDGSAKVALIGIDHSIMAWIALRQYLPERKDDIIDLLVFLDRLRKNIEKHFPDARVFIRPGFDEIGQ